MGKQLEQVPRNPTQKQLHRLRLLPIVEFLDEEVTLKVPTPGGLRQPGDVLTTSLFGLEPWEQAQLQFKPGVAKPETRNLDMDDPEFGKLATIPMMVLKGIAKKQGEDTPAMQSEISGAAGNAAVVGLGNIAGYVFKYGSTLLIQRGLGGALFGVYTFGFSIANLVAPIFAFGMDSAMIRYVASYRGTKQTQLLRSVTVFCTAVVGLTGILGALLMMYFAGPLALLQRKPEFASVLVLMAPLVPLLCLQAITLGGLQGLKEFKKRVFIQRVLEPVIIFALMLVTILFFRNIFGVVTVTFLDALFTLVINLWFLFRSISRIVEPGPENYKVREWIGFAVPSFLTNTLTTALSSISPLLLAFYVTTLAIGQYVGALRINTFIGLPLLSLNTIFAPTIAELYSRGKRQNLDAMFKVMTKWSILLTIPIFEIVVIFAVPILSISGKDFIPAWPILVVLATGNMLSAVPGSVGYMLLMTGHQKIAIINSFTMVILNIGLGIILTQHYGAFGMAIATSVAIVVANLMKLIQVWILLKMQPYQWDTLKPVGAGLISGLLTWGLLYLFDLGIRSIPLLDHSPLPIQLVLVPVFLLSYIGLLLLFKLDSEDQIVVDRLRKKFNFGKKKNKHNNLNRRSQDMSALQERQNFYDYQQDMVSTKKARR